jgi:hypothetical protein
LITTLLADPLEAFDATEPFEALEFLESLDLPEVAVFFLRLTGVFYLDF